MTHPAFISAHGLMSLELIESRPRNGGKAPSDGESRSGGYSNSDKITAPRSPPSRLVGMYGARGHARVTPVGRHERSGKFAAMSTGPRPGDTEMRPSQPMGSRTWIP